VTERERKLMKEGWERRFFASEPRLSEMAELYEETGFDVHLEPLSAVEEPNKTNEECQGCNICFEGCEDEYKVIFTRPKRGVKEEDGKDIIGEDA
jgi:MinD superfamily P-loop ATPase